MAEEKKESKELNNVAELLGIKDVKNMPEWLAPLLSGLGGVGASYLFLVKPLQERVDVAQKAIEQLQELVMELREKNEEYSEELENIKAQLESNLNGESYLPIKRPAGKVKFLRKRI